MSLFSKLLVAGEKFFSGFFKSLLPSDQAKAVEAGIVAFIKTDVGALALDAINYASTLAGQDTVALRAAAVGRLEGDLKAAGKDATALSLSTLSLFVEMAYTYAKGNSATLLAAVLP